MRIAFTGKAGVGKTTAAMYLVRAYGMKRHSFAEPLKVMARELWPEQFENGKPRVLLQELGMLLRGFDRDVWANYLVRTIVSETAVDGKTSFVVDDLRYLNEEKILRLNGFKICRIVGPQRVEMPPGSENHPSETEQDSINADIILLNNGSKMELYSLLDETLANNDRF